MLGDDKDFGLNRSEDALRVKCKKKVVLPLDLSPRVREPTGTVYPKPSSDTQSNTKGILIVVYFLLLAMFAFGGCFLRSGDNRLVFEAAVVISGIYFLFYLLALSFVKAL